MVFYLHEALEHLLSEPLVLKGDPHLDLLIHHNPFMCLGSLEQDVILQILFLFPDPLLVLEVMHSMKKIPTHHAIISSWECWHLADKLVNPTCNSSTVVWVFCLKILYILPWYILKMLLDCVLDLGSLGVSGINF